ncbi:MAG TPA: hypothetical protein VNJ71_02410 [Gemmatimonadales bacterium]|nr:hypothetical protein [Gemmatimonadales bacterium]
MDDAVKLFGILVAIASAGAVAYLLISLAAVLARRLQGRPGSAAPEAEVAELRARLEEQDQFRLRLLELEERVDFVERLLAQQRDAQRLEAR